MFRNGKTTRTGREETLPEPVTPDPATIKALGRIVHPDETAERGRRRIARAAGLGEIAVRVWTEPDAWKLPRRRARNTVEAPNVALGVVTVPAPGSDALWFLLWAFMPDVRGLAPPVLGVAWREGVPSGDIERIRAWARSRGILPCRVGPLQEFLKRAFRWLYRKGYRIPLVGWVLPRDLGRMASDWYPAENDGYSLALWTQPDRQKRWSKRRRARLRTGRIENPNRPRVNVVGIGGGRALMSFGGRLKADRRDRIPEGRVRPKAKWNYAGRFVDLAAFASGPDGLEADSLEEAAASYGVEVETPVLVGNGLTDALETAAARLVTICRLYSAVTLEHERHVGIDVQAHQVLGPPSYARAYLEAAGLVPLLRRFKAVPKWALAKAFAAYHGGEHRIGFLVPPHIPVPVIPLDFSGQFPVVAVHGGVWELFCAKSLEVREQTPEQATEFVADLAKRLRAWIRHGAEVVPPIQSAEWRYLLRTFVDVLADRDVLPRKIRRPGGKTWQMRVGPLSTAEPVPFCLADVLRATLESPGLEVPRIASAFTLVPHGRIRMRPVELPDGTVVFPGEDLILALIRMRKAVAGRTDLPARVRERLADWSKAVANAIVSGLPAQMNPRSPISGTRRVHVWGPDGSHRILRAHVVEAPGAWCFPPIAAGVTAGGRLLLCLARELVRSAGGVTLYEAVDSLAIVASADRGFLPVAGGLLLRDGVAGINVLGSADVTRIMQRIETFSPYERDPAGPALLKVESEARDQEAFMLAVSPLRAYIYSFVLDGHGRHDLEILKASGQSLGQLLPPPGGGPDWIERAAEHVLRIRFGMSSEEPAGWDAAAMAVVPVAVPGESVDAKGRDRRPWSLLAVARPHPIHPPRLADGSPALPAAIWDEAFDSTTAAWFDLASGEPIASGIRAAPEDGRETYGPKGWVLAYRQVVESHFARVPDHMLGPDGESLIPGALGMLTASPIQAFRVRLIGREMHLLDRVGVTIDPVYADYTDHAGTRRLALGVLRDHGAAIVRRRTGLPRRTVERFLKTGRTSAERWGRYIQAAGELASEALGQRDPGLGIPADPVARCYLYLREAARLPKHCRQCGGPLRGRQQKWCRKACQMRAIRSTSV